MADAARPEAPPPIDPARDHVRGDGPHTLLLYVNYADPRSRDAYRVAQALEADGVPFRLVVRHLPLGDERPEALQASVAAEAAHDQGRFWDMHDLLLAAQDKLGRSDLRQYADVLSLDAHAFTRGFAGDAQLSRITEDVRGALHAGATATPALYLDGLPVTDASPEALRAALTR